MTHAVPVLGMVGGGQLARMTHQAVVGLGIDFRVLAEQEAASTSSVAAGARTGSWRSLSHTSTIASCVGS